MRYGLSVDSVLQLTCYRPACRVVRNFAILTPLHWLTIAGVGLSARSTGSEQTDANAVRSSMVISAGSLQVRRRTDDDTAVVEAAVSAAPQRGYLLLELAVALVIVGLLAGSMLSNLPQQLEQARRQVTQQRLQQVRTALLGYLLRHQRLPCPARNGSAPEACSGAALSGTVPAGQLGVDGPVDRQGQLLDAWHRPIRYQVSGADSAVSGRQEQPDLLVSGELRRVGLQYLRPDLAVCSTPALARCPRYAVLASEVPFVVWSNGRLVAESIAEQANRDGDRLFNNIGYVGSIKSGEQGFDDMLLWVSSNEMIMHLIDAGVLP